MLWIRLCESVGGFTEVHRHDGWSAIELGVRRDAMGATGFGDCVVWLDRGAVKKIGPWGGVYARLATRKDMKLLCQANYKADGRESRKDALQAASTGKDEVGWREWWGDFQLNVGQVTRIMPPDESNNYYRVLISFPGTQVRTRNACGGTQVSEAVLTVPVGCLTAATESQFFAEYIAVPQPVVLRSMMAIFVASTPPILALKAIFNLMRFVYFVYYPSGTGRAGVDRRWEAYQEVYFRLLNSGYPTLLCDAMTVSLYFYLNWRPTFMQFSNAVGVPVVACTILAVLLSLPAIVTHVIPMMFYYFWLWLLIPFFISILVFIWHRRPILRSEEIPEERMYDMAWFRSEYKLYLLKSTAVYIFIRLTAELIVIVFFQTTYNYALLTWQKWEDQPYSYLGTIMEEWQRRTYRCLSESLENFISLAATMDILPDMLRSESNYST